MAQQKSIKKNFVMNVVLTMSSFIFPLITFPYVSTILTPARYGTVTFATSIISYFNLFAQLGIPTYGIRAVAQVRDDKEELTRLQTEIVKYMEEFITKCMVGGVTDSAWDTYLATLQNLKVDRYCELYQKAYDSLKK